MSGFVTSLWDALANDSTRNVAVVMGVLVALTAVFTSRELARKKQSADILFATRGDTKLQDGHALLRTYHNAADKNIRTLADPALSESDEAKTIRYLLNHFEVISVGLRAGIFDEQMLKDSWYTMVIDTFDQAHPLIEALRKKSGKDTILQEFECLTKRWKDNPLKRKKHWPNGVRAWLSS